MKDSQEQSENQRKQKFPPWGIVLCGALVLAGVVAWIVLGRGSDPAPGAREEQPPQTMDVQTNYGTVKYPAEYGQYLSHEATQEGDTTVEVYSMQNGEDTQELFRVYYGSAEGGTPVGYLHTESGVVPVSVQITEDDAVSFDDEETRQRFVAMREGVGTVLDAVCSDERFQEHGVSEAQSGEIALTYWTVSLPQGMECEESREADSYQAVFYGTVGEKKLKLYTIRLDDSDETASIGTYSVDGAEKWIHIETEDPTIPDDSPEDERYLVSRYMETVNDVIQTIISSENYSDGLKPSE